MLFLSLFAANNLDLICTCSCPTESSTYEWKQAPHSTLVVRHGDDHGTIIGVSCVGICSASNITLSLPLLVPGPARSLEIEFLNTGVFPKSINQTFVTVYAPGSVRAPVSDPYLVPVGPLAGDIY